VTDVGLVCVVERYDLTELKGYYYYYYYNKYVDFLNVACRAISSSAELSGTCVVKGVKGEKGDTGRGSMTGVGGGLDTSGFPAGFVEGPQGPPGRKVC